MSRAGGFGCTMRVAPHHALMASGAALGVVELGVVALGVVALGVVALP